MRSKQLVIMGMQYIPIMMMICVKRFVVEDFPPEPDSIYLPSKIH